MKSSEWNQIVKDAFSSEEVHAFSDRYNARKAGLKKGIIMHPARNRRKAIAVSAVLIAALVAVPTSVFAYRIAIRAEMTKTAPYQHTVTVAVPTAEEQTDVPDAGELLDTSCKAVSYGYLPEGVTLQGEDTAYAGKYKNEEGEGFTPVFYRIPNGTTVEENLKFTEEMEQYTSGDKTIMICYRMNHSQELNFDRECWVYFEGTPYILNLFFTSGISDADMKQTMEQLTLVPSDTETAGIWEKAEPASYVAEERYIPDVSLEELSLFGVGDTVSSPFLETVTNEKVTVTLDSVQLQDNFDGITTDAAGYPKDYSEYLTADGMVKDNERIWYNRGNGVDTLDEEIRTEILPQKVMVLHLTYTNESEQDVEYCVSPYLFTLEGSKAFRVDRLMEEAAETYSDSLHRLKQAYGFSYQSEHSGFKNNLMLAPGESAEVQLAFLVDEEMLDSLYLMGMPALGEIGEEAEAGTPVFDLAAHENQF